MVVRHGGDESLLVNILHAFVRLKEKRLCFELGKYSQSECYLYMCVFNRGIRTGLRGCQLGHTLYTRNIINLNIWDILGRFGARGNLYYCE